MSLRSGIARAAGLAWLALAGSCGQGRLGTELPVQLEVSPPRVAVALGTSTQFLVFARYRDGALRAVTDEVVWRVDDEALATLGAPGNVQGVGLGTVAVHVRHEASALSATAELLITPAVLTAIAVTPSNPSLAAGTTQQFAATGTFSDNTTQDLTDQVVWSSDATGTATVSNGVGFEGLATAVAPGAATIAATHVASGVQGLTTLTVTSALLTSLAVTPSSPSVAAGTTQQFTATGTFSDSSTQDLTDQVTWSSSAGGVATIDNGAGNEGLATAVAVGSSTITATHAASSRNDATVLTVTPAVLVLVTVTPADPAIALGTAQQFAATGTFSDSSTQDLTEQVTWSTSNATVATVANSSGNEGLATSAGVGLCTITALHVASSISGATSLEVTPAVLVSLAVTPQAPWVLAGTTRQFTATGTFSDSSTQDVTDQVTWSSGTTAAATISNAGGSQGLLTAVAAGTTVITAMDAGTSVQGTATATVIDQIEARGATGAGADTGVLSLTLTTPVDHEVGDVLLAAVAVRPNTATVTPPTGWTLVRRVDNSSGAAHSLLLYTRPVAASEPADHTFTFSASTGSAGGISCFSGIDTTTPIGVEAGQNTASGLSHASPGVVAGATDCMVFTVHAMSSASSWTPPTAMTEAFDARSMVATAATGICVCGCYALQSSAGNTGARTATAAGDADVGNTAIVVLSRAP